ncbi:MAG: TMF family protein [Herminiimonas sp.]|nr:TMF family protein [Herminiimonas sp.]
MAAVGVTQGQSEAFISMLPINSQNHTASPPNVNETGTARGASVALTGGRSDRPQSLDENHDAHALGGLTPGQAQQSSTAPAQDAVVKKLQEMVEKLSKELSSLTTEIGMLSAANGELNRQLTAKRTPAAEAVSGAYPNRANGSNNGSTGSSSLFGNHLNSMAPGMGSSFGGFPGKSNSFALGGLVGMGIGSSLIGALLLGGLMF